MNRIPLSFLAAMIALTSTAHAGGAGAIDWFWSADAENQSLPHYFGIDELRIEDGLLRGIFNEPNSDNMLVFNPEDFPAEDYPLIIVEAAFEDQQEVAVLYRPSAHPDFSPFRVANYKGELPTDADEGVLVLDLSRHPIWEGEIGGVRLSFPASTNGTSFSLARVGLASDWSALEGWEHQVLDYIPPADWFTHKLRRDVAHEPPPILDPPEEQDWTIGVWYFGAWEPEYSLGGWEIMAYEHPERLPLLYDSSAPESQHFGIQYYRNASPKVMEWHVHWMRNHGINLMLFTWFPMVGEDGGMVLSHYANRSIEKAFLGKEEVGGPPVETNPFADKMTFAIQWTNHFEAEGYPRGLFEYAVEQFFSQPNYLRIDGRPVFIVHSNHEFFRALGRSQEAAMAELAAWKDIAAEAGLPEPYLMCSAFRDAESAQYLLSLGYDGVLHYATGLIERDATITEKVDRSGYVWREVALDFESQSIPNHVQVWDEVLGAVGEDYILSAVPMMDMSGTGRPARHVTKNATPKNFRTLLRAAKQAQAKHDSRRMLVLYAWNEWFEGGYLEPSTEFGYDWLKSIKEEFSNE